MKGKKSSGVDWICGYSLKIAAKDLQPELKRIINLSIRTGQFFSQWKYSKILPGFKNKGNKFEAEFYRPIANLSEVSKLAERAVYNQIYQYLKENGLFHPDHHGCHENHSTSTALQQLIDIWLAAAEEGKLSAAVMIDLRAGFDVVNHSLLLLKLKEYGCDEVSLSWFTNYLSNRYQCVQVESALSATLPVPWGVPQGSILGPLLFLIFLNELPEIIKQREGQNETTSEANIVVFVDDNTPTVSDKNPINLLEKAQQACDKIALWFGLNDLTCSGEKTKLLVVGTREHRQAKLSDIEPQLTVCGDLVKNTTSEKLLGIVVNNTVTWHHQLHGDGDNPGLLPTLSKRVGILRKLRKVTPDRKFRQLVSGLFTSKMMYGATVWGGVWGIPGDLSDGNLVKTSISKSDMRKLQVLQNKVMRLETRLPTGTPTSVLLEKTGNLSVHQLIAYYSMTQVYKIIINKQPHHHYQRLVTEELTDTGTWSCKPKRVDFKLSLSRGSFFYQASRLWAALPVNIQNSSKVETFKKECRKWTRLKISVKP